MRALLVSIAVLAAAPAVACEYPDEGNMPLRRAVTRVQMLPETRDWDTERRFAGELVQYELSLTETVWKNGKCHWTVRASANGKLWRVFYVSPDGKSILRPAPER